jgi:hypothetical protein
MVKKQLACQAEDKTTLLVPGPVVMQIIDVFYSWIIEEYDFSIATSYTYINLSQKWLLLHCEFSRNLSRAIFKLGL